MKYKLTDKAKEMGCVFEKPRDGDAGYDIYAADDLFLYPGESAWIETGLYVEIPKGYVGIVKERSSMANLFHVHAGVIDSSYRGEVKVLAHVFVDAADQARMTGYILDSVGMHVAKKDLLRHRIVKEKDISAGVSIDAGMKIAQLIIIPVHTPRLTEVDELSQTERGQDGFGSTGS